MVEKDVGAFRLRVWCGVCRLRSFSDVGSLDLRSKLELRKEEEKVKGKGKIPQVGQKVLLELKGESQTLKLRSMISGFENDFLLIDTPPLHLHGFIYTETKEFIGFVLPVSINSQLTVGVSLTHWFKSKFLVRTCFDVPVYKVFSGMQGSGVVISSEFIVTNAHVVSGSSTCSLGSLTNNTGRLLKKGKILDLALLELATKETPCKLAQAFEEGQRVYTIGFGIVRQSVPLITSGYLTKIVYYQGQALLGMINAKTFNGQSGGGVFNESFELLGIITANAQDTNDGIYEDLGFCILTTAFKAFVESKDSSALRLFDDESPDLKSLCEFQTTKYLPSPKV